MKTTIILILIHLCILSTYADIRPNPIKAKGIVSGVNTSISMDSEQVVVDLYKDSAIVECHFYMKNDSNAQQLTIGFPEMNFHYFRQNDGAEINNFSVYENGEKIKLISLHQPETASTNEQVLFSGIINQKSEDQPWFIWNSSFDKDELKTIVVRYSLPYGAMKNGSRYFTYLLNTGSGWKGNIGKADIVVNLKDIQPDLILKAVPENYKITGNQLSWSFSNFEPTTTDDIKIYYEPSKGYYKPKSKENTPVVVVNNKVIPDINLFELEPMGVERLAELIHVKVEEIESLQVLKDKETMEKYNTENGVLIIYTKDYIKNNSTD